MLKIILAPIVGGVIGYITNDLAIKMLFHPHKPLYIGKWHIPFTPGLIPSQKERIAKSLGGVISKQLLNAETIQKEALKEENVKSIKRGVESALTNLFQDETIIREKLETRFAPEKIALFEDQFTDMMADAIFIQIRKAGIGTIVSHAIMEAASEKLQIFGISLALLGGAAGIERAITSMVDAKIEEKGPEMIRSKVEEMEKDFLSRKISDISGAYAAKIPEIANKIVGLYETIITRHLGSLLDKAKIDVIIENKIASFDAAQLEKMIFGIMKRELNAIVYLGAALGFLMGFVNLLW